ncbi:MAG TPA: hypothetical protein VKY92_25545 [Verrucomicrobiae bacterium]|nr:hypothetical protein [Verrucomicrobiae bacterium]
METNSRVCIVPAGDAAAGHDQLGNKLFSPQKRPLQVAAALNPAPSLRVPVVPENRQYLKALRQAELRAWKSIRSEEKPSLAAARGSVRLPTHKPTCGEDRVFALLALLCGLTLILELNIVLHAASGWHNFVEYVRRVTA